MNPPGTPGIQGKPVMRHVLPALLLLTAPAVLAADAGPAPRQEKKPVRTIEQVKLLYFHAGWCQSCKRLDESGVLRQLVEQEPGLVIEKVDVDASEKLLDRYGVEVTPTLILVDADGFPLGRPSITLDAPEKTLTAAVKLVRKMTGRPTK